MQWSTERILTTHTGSLPRPPELTRLYIQRDREGAIDPDELDRVGKAALGRIIDKQTEAGIDIGNNGEQQCHFSKSTSANCQTRLQQFGTVTDCVRIRPSRPGAKPPPGGAAGWPCRSAVCGALQRTMT